MIEVLNPLTISDWMRLQVTRSRKVGNALKGATFISTIIYYEKGKNGYLIVSMP